MVYYAIFFRVLERVFYCYNKIRNNHFSVIPNNKDEKNTSFLPIFMPFLAMFCSVWYNLLGNSKNWLKMAYFDVFEQMFIEHTFYRTNVCTNDCLVM